MGEKPFENIVGKGENAGNQHLLLFPQYFLPFVKPFQFFNHIYFFVCKFFQFLLFGKELSPPLTEYASLILVFPKQALVFTCLQYNSFEKNVGKGEIAHNKQNLLFSQCLLPFWQTFCHVHQIQNCHLQTLSDWKSPKFVVWEKVNITETYDFFTCNWYIMIKWHFVLNWNTNLSSFSIYLPWCLFYSQHVQAVGVLMLLSKSRI